MQLRFFTIPIHGGEAAAEDLNRFLSMHRILAVDRSFAQDGASSAWALCISFEPSDGRTQTAKPRPKIDYREILNEQDFALFARLRAVRKTLADSEGIPAYALFTNEQLAEMVQRRVRTKSAMGNIPGIGAARLEKYGEAFLQVLCQPAPSKEDGHET